MKTLVSIILTGLFFMLPLSNDLMAGEKKLTRVEKTQIIDSLEVVLHEKYVFPELAEKAIVLIREKHLNKEYSNINDPHSFAVSISRDIDKICNDAHLKMNYDPALENELLRVKEPNEEEKSLSELRSIENYGFKEVKVLDGNIGYIDLRVFDFPEFAGETAVNAMNLLSSTKAIIFDLRQNIGGSPEMIKLIQSYLFGDEPVHLNDFYFRPENKTTQSWTMPHVTGKRMPDAEVFVLTSDRTFSAGEEFAYNLKHLKRATIIGEVTGGGANTGTYYTLGNGFNIFVPSGRAINPVTGTNWEGKGVTPHFEVEESMALDKAYEMALQNLIENAKEDKQIQYFNWHLMAVKAKINPVQINEELLEKYVGDYSGKKIGRENGELYYLRKGNRLKLYPLSKTTFGVENMDNLRLVFDEEGKTLNITYNIYRKIPYKRTE